MGGKHGLLTYYNIFIHNLLKYVYEVHGIIAYQEQLQNRKPAHKFLLLFNIHPVSTCTPSFSNSPIPRLGATPPTNSNLKTERSLLGECSVFG